MVKPAAASSLGSRRSCAAAVAAVAQRRSSLPALLLGFLTISSCAGWGPSLVLADVQVKWTAVAPMPYAVGETSAGILKGAHGEPLLVAVGYNHKDDVASAATMVLDINANKWSVKAPRPFPGHHMASVTWGNMLYIIGGYIGKTPENMQIYDPVKDAWTVGPKPSFKSGAVGAAVINGVIYYCGGIKDGNTKSGKPLTTCAKFNIASNKWSFIAPMPHAVHHHSMGSDGKYVYVFGGRNSVGNNALKPTNYTQMYDPETNSWKSNTDVDGPKAVPVGRGGTGAAAYYKDRFWMIGGEAQCGKTWMGNCPNDKINYLPGGVLDRLDRYDPATNTWDRGLPGMPLPRHGAYPVVGPAPGTGAQVVWVCAGGIVEGYNENTICTYMTA